MFPGAYSILDRLGLPRPPSFGVTEVSSSEFDRFYLRFSSSSGTKGGVSSRRELLGKRRDLLIAEERGELVCIEPFYKIDLGGAMLFSRRFHYIEAVVGHPESLLRRGVCGFRALWSGDLPPLFFKQFQGWKAVRGPELLWSPAAGISEDDVEWILRMPKIFIGSQSLAEGEALLLEWFRTDAGAVLFCDAKPFKSGQFVRHFVASYSLLDCSGFAECFQVDGLDIDYQDASGKEGLIIANGAVLSHFVVRNSSLFRAIVFLGPIGGKFIEECFRLDSVGLRLGGSSS